MSSKTSSEKVLILTPTFNDASVAIEVLGVAGIQGEACGSLHEICEKMDSDCGAIVLSEDAVHQASMITFQDHIASQPAWSDVPIILITSSGIAQVTEIFSNTGNISLLERPFSRLTLVRSVEVALRARRRQYEVRDLLNALNKAKEEAEKANLSKTQFLANMSHEIRTPIGAILGFIDLIKTSHADSAENLRYMGIVERNSQQLLRLIDDILDLSKVEAGKMTIENIVFSLTEMLSDFVSMMSFRAAEKNIRFQLMIETPIPDFIISDPVRVRQVLNNIVGNALKFTHYGSVQMMVSYQNSLLKFIVQDTGVGISKDQEARLFQPFSQADTSTTRKFGGTGLGLVLSRKLAEALGGRLELLESHENAGSIFLIEIKPQLSPQTKLVGKESLSFAHGSSNPVKPELQLKTLRVLLVEDSPDNQVLITTYLRKEGAEVTTATNGDEGVTLALKDNFDLVLMDVQMPVLDGHEATKKLRQAQYQKPIIALTAHAMKEERKKSIESGFTEFLTKPVQRDLLIEMLSSYVPTKN